MMTEISLDDHNRHLAILGLPPVISPLVAGPTSTPMPPAKPGSPLAMLDKFYAGEGPTAPRGRFIHWWGQFSNILPAPFCLKGGHGYIEARDVAHATELFAELRNAVLAMKPKRDEDYGLDATREWAGISNGGMVWYRWMLMDNRQMTVELRKSVSKSDLAGERMVRIA
jgi:hypothetical protein